MKRLLNNILTSLFNRHRKRKNTFKRMRSGDMYAITGGDRTGGFIVRVREYDSYGGLAFLFIPDPMESLFLSEEEVQKLFNYDYLDFAQSIVIKEAYDVVRANWKFFADKQGLDYEDR